MKTTVIKRIFLLSLVSAAFFGSTSVRAADDDDDSNYTIEEVQACSQDAMTLCRDAIPDVHKVRLCMIAKKTQLSKPCQAMFR